MGDGVAEEMTVYRRGERAGEGNRVARRVAEGDFDTDQS
jgi:hypothetical protein